jgi:hypothetical protein
MKNTMFGILIGLTMAVIWSSLDFAPARKYLKDEAGEEIRRQKSDAVSKHVEEAIKKAHDGDIIQYEFLESLNDINPEKTKEDLARMAAIRSDWKWIDGKPVFVGTRRR